MTGSVDALRFLPIVDEEADCASEITREFLNYWTSKLAGREMPSRADIDPLEITSILPHTGLVAIEEDPRRYFWRLVGTHITTATGRDHTGRYFDELYPPMLLKDISSLYARVVEQRFPIRHYGVTTFAEKNHLKYESLLMPLSSDGTRVEMVFAGIHYMD
jgi:hypothetical protein